MAKRKTIGPHTGIYQRAILVLKQDEPTPTRETLKQRIDAIDRICIAAFEEFVPKPWPPNLEGELVFATLSYRKGKASPKPGWLKALRNSLAPNELELLLDAANCRRFINRLYGEFQPLSVKDLESLPLARRRSFLKRHQAGAPYRIANAAMMVGQLYERMHVRLHEPDARAGRNSSVGRSKAGANRGQRNAQKYAAWQKRIDELRAGGKKLSHHGACLRIVAEFEYPGRNGKNRHPSLRTVKTNTTNRTKRAKK